MNLTEEILIPDSLDAIDKRLEGLTPEDALLELTDWLADYEKHRQEAQDLLEVIETDFTFQDLKKVVFGADKDLLNWYWEEDRTKYLQDKIDFHQSLKQAVQARIQTLKDKGATLNAEFPLVRNQQAYLCWSPRVHQKKKWIHWLLSELHQNPGNSHWYFPHFKVKRHARVFAPGEWIFNIDDSFKSWLEEQLVHLPEDPVVQSEPKPEPSRPVSRKRNRDPAESIVKDRFMELIDRTLISFGDGNNDWMTVVQNLARNTTENEQINRDNTHVTFTFAHEAYPVSLGKWKLSTFKKFVSERRQVVFPKENKHS